MTRQPVAHHIIDQHNEDMAEIARQAWDRATRCNERHAAISEHKRRETDRAVKSLRRALSK